MEHNSPVIERLAPPVGPEERAALAALLVDAVESGAAVSFLAPLTIDEAASWWRSALEAPTKPAVLVARDGASMVGCVLLTKAWAPNQPRRGEISKLIVHRRSRRRGVARRLMQAAEDAARAAGLDLLTLDAKVGAGADALYAGMGWTRVGVIPEFALDPDGREAHDAVLFYKRLDR